MHLHSLSTSNAPWRQYIYRDSRQHICIGPIKIFLFSLAARSPFVHSVTCQESADDAVKASQKPENFTAAFFRSWSPLWCQRKRRSCSGKALFRLVESKLGRQNAVMGKENADEPGNARRRVNHRRMYVSTRSLHAAIIHKVHLARDERTDMERAILHCCTTRLPLEG